MLQDIYDYFAQLTPARDDVASYRELQSAYAQLKEESTSLNLNGRQRAIYGLTRFPQTSAALTKVLQELIATHSGFLPKKILDIGSGPGTGLFVLDQLFKHEFSYIGIEKDRGFIDMSLSAIKNCAPHLSNRCQFIHGDIFKQSVATDFDLTIISYVLSETPEHRLRDMMTWVQRHTKGMVIIVDAGMKKSFGQLAQARTHLIELGATIVAPCPHQRPCPLVQASDFCHFPVRLMRPARMKHAKLASAQQEYENFLTWWQVLRQSLRLPAFRGSSKNPCAARATSFLTCAAKKAHLRG